MGPRIPGDEASDRPLIEEGQRPRVPLDGVHHDDVGVEDLAVHLDGRHMQERAPVRVEQYVRLAVQPSLVVAGTFHRPHLKTIDTPNDRLRYTQTPSKMPDKIERTTRFPSPSTRTVYIF